MGHSYHLIAEIKILHLNNIPNFLYNTFYYQGYVFSATPNRFCFKSYCGLIGYIEKAPEMGGFAPIANYHKKTCFQWI